MAGGLVQVRAATLTLLCLGAVAQTATAGGDEAGPDAAIRATWAALDEAWNARDANHFAEQFAADTSFRFVDRGQSMDGRAAVRDEFAERFPRVAPELRHRTTVQQTWPVGRDVHALDGTVDILRADTDAGLTRLRSFEIFAVMAPTGDAWQISVLRVYPSPAESEDP